MHCCQLQLRRVWLLHGLMIQNIFAYSVQISSTSIYDAVSEQGDGQVVVLPTIDEDKLESASSTSTESSQISHTQNVSLTTPIARQSRSASNQAVSIMSTAEPDSVSDLLSGLATKALPKSGPSFISDGSAMPSSTSISIAAASSGLLSTLMGSNVISITTSINSRTNASVSAIDAVISPSESEDNYSTTKTNQMMSKLSQEESGPDADATNYVPDRSMASPTEISTTAPANFASNMPEDTLTVGAPASTILTSSPSQSLATISSLIPIVNPADMVSTLPPGSLSEISLPDEQSATSNVDAIVFGSHTSLNPGMKGTVSGLPVASFSLPNTPLGTLLLDETVVTSLVGASTVIQTFKVTTIPSMKTIQTLETTSTTLRIGSSPSVVPMLIWPGGLAWNLASPTANAPILTPPTKPPGAFLEDQVSSTNPEGWAFPALTSTKNSPGATAIIPFVQVASQTKKPAWITKAPLPTASKTTTPLVLFSITSGVTEDGHRDHKGHPKPVFWHPHCVLFCPSAGCDVCGIQLDLDPGIYPPGIIHPPPDWKGDSLPTITIHQDGDPEYNSESENCKTNTATDTTFYVKYRVDGAGRTTETATTSTATHLTVGCSVTGTKTDVSDVNSVSSTLSSSIVTSSVISSSVSSNQSIPAVTPTEIPEVLGNLTSVNSEALTRLASALDLEWSRELEALGVPVFDSMLMTGSETMTTTRLPSSASAESIALSTNSLETSNLDTQTGPLTDTVNVPTTSMISASSPSPTATSRSDTDLETATGAASVPSETPSPNPPIDILDPKPEEAGLPTAALKPDHPRVVVGGAKPPQ